jgi:SAM-dependent methyltransferase
MRLEVKAEGAHEESLPEPMRELLTLVMETVQAPLHARAFQWGIWLGLFDALAGGPLPAKEVAERCNLGPRATNAVLALFATTGYVEHANGVYALTALGRRWLPGVRTGTPVSYYLMGLLEWDWLAYLPVFLRTGKAIDFHAKLSSDQWRVYQDAMYVATKRMAAMIADAITIPEGPTRFLDVAGGHGFLAIELCRRHPQLEAVVIDLQPALDASQVWFDLESKTVDGRVTRRACNAVTEDFGESDFDVIGVKAFVHVLSGDENRRLVKRCARALRPNGQLVLMDTLAQEYRSDDGELTAFYNLLMALICASGFWTLEDMESWQREAGLDAYKSFRIEGRFGAVIGSKSTPA